MTSISGLWSSVTFAGYSTSVNTSTVTSGLTTVAESIKNRSETTYYVIGTYAKSVSATFYYSKATDGTVGSVRSSGTKLSYIMCENNTTASTGQQNETITQPTISDEIAPTGTVALTGFATANTNMNTTSSYTTNSVAKNLLLSIF